MIYPHAYRLHPGDDLKKSILQICHQFQIQAGVIASGVGSLSHAEIRLADGKSPTQMKGPFEIVSLTGTCCKNGIHLHISLANKEGTVIGGHLLDGCLIHTTAEIVIFELKNYQFYRQPDSKTGYLELEIHPVASKD